MTKRILILWFWDPVIMRASFIQETICEDYFSLTLPFWEIKLSLLLKYLLKTDFW